MRRLAIVDIDGGNQPIYTDDRRLALINNGEIYNAPELRAELEAKGHRFSTDHSDTEVILRGYEEWGQDVVTHLTGMFAFALWDSTHQELFLARDRLGIKPLYYVAARRAGWSSRRRSRRSCRTRPSRAARTSRVLQRFLLFRVHDATEDTFFDGIKRLLPAHTMTVGPEGIRGIRRYWNPEVNLEFSGSRSDDEYAAEFAALFDRVVARHLLSDAPVGVPLSGGLELQRCGVHHGPPHGAGHRPAHRRDAAHVLGAVPRADDRREPVHPRGGEGHRQRSALRVPEPRRVLAGDAGMGVVPGGTDDRLRAVRVLLRVPRRQGARQGDALRQRRRRAARRLHPVLPRLPHLRARPGPLAGRRPRAGDRAPTSTAATSARPCAHGCPAGAAC